MKTSKKYLLSWALLIVPGAACAESDDAKYCALLADKYLDYVGHDDLSPGTTPNPAYITVAIAKCESNPAGSIPVLEQVLKNAKINLPPRR